MKRELRAPNVSIWFVSVDYSLSSQDRQQHFQMGTHEHNIHPVFFRSPPKCLLFQYQLPLIWFSLPLLFHLFNSPDSIRCNAHTPFSSAHFNIYVSVCTLLPQRSDRRKRIRKSGYQHRFISHSVLGGSSGKCRPWLLFAHPRLLTSPYYFDQVSVFLGLKQVCCCCCCCLCFADKRAPASSAGCSLFFVLLLFLLLHLLFVVTALQAKCTQ